MRETVQCKRCNISAEELRAAGELGDSRLVGVIGYCLNCCPEEDLFQLTETIKQALSNQ
jgi:hypothetical protein